MNLYQTTLVYFRELSHLPRMPLHEDAVRSWIIVWAEKKWWNYEKDTIGNLLVIASGNKEKSICLQWHMDMVCVSVWHHNFMTQGVMVIEKDGKLKAQKTTLWADNGIAVATMMALADTEDRPTLELVFTIGEEVGLVGAHNITLPIQAPLALNLDWCDSNSIGIGCGSTLLMHGTREILQWWGDKKEDQENIFEVILSGMQWGHSGMDIRYYRGNALIEILKIIEDLSGIKYVWEINGGDADNAIPRNSKSIVSYSGHPNLFRNQLGHIQKILRTKYKNESITIMANDYAKPVTLYWRVEVLPILSDIIEAGTGVQTWWGHNTPLSSWNLGLLTMKQGKIMTSYFLRSNLIDGIEPMKTNLTTSLPETEWTMSQDTPVWLSDTASPFVTTIQEVFRDIDDEPLPAITIHATVEAGMLAQKYPQTQWVSIGATIHHMHTTEEYIETKDFEKFVERMEALIATLG